MITIFTNVRITFCLMSLKNDHWFFWLWFFVCFSIITNLTESTKEINTKQNILNWFIYIWMHQKIFLKGALRSKVQRASIMLNLPVLKLGLVVYHLIITNLKLFNFEFEKLEISIYLWIRSQNCFSINFFLFFFLF